MRTRAGLIAALAAVLIGQAGQAAERHYLYVAEPGIRNYVEYGGIGVLVFDIDHGYRFVKRIPTWETPAGKEPENVKGIAASAATGRLYVTTFNRMAAFEIATGRKIWDRTYEGGCDRMAISPDGKILDVPSFEGAHWNVVAAETGPGFEVGDVETGKMLYRVEFQGYKPGPLKRHGCPSHGIALSPDETELWVVDGANNCLHVFDATVMPPKPAAIIKLRDFPGWISFSIDGRHAYSSTGEIIDAATKKVVATLTDESARQVQSEKMLELVFDGDKVIGAGNQFGVGAKR